MLLGFGVGDRHLFVAGIGVLTVETLRYFQPFPSSVFVWVRFSYVPDRRQDSYSYHKLERQMCLEWFVDGAEVQQP